MEGRGDLGEDGLDLFEVAHVAAFPFDLGVGFLFLDVGDGVVALFFFAIDHDDFHASEGEGAADFIAGESTAREQRSSGLDQEQAHPIPRAPPVTSATRPLRFSGWTSLGPTMLCRTDCMMMVVR